MKNILTLIAIILLTNNYIFSAYVGGVINYRHISGYTYEVKVLVCNTSTLHDSVLVNFGDGASSNLARIGSSGNSNYTISTYLVNHTYPGPGIYNINCSINNWDNGYVNIPNSSNFPLSLMASININATIGSNSTPIYTYDLFVDTAIVGQPYLYNAGIFDSEGDSISYKLTDCINIPAYSLPDTIPYFTMDSLTGNINWNTPHETGKWAIAYMVEEWRMNNSNYLLINQTIWQMTIVVKDNASVETVNAENKIHIYPNPTTGIIKINAENIKNVFIINEIGETILNLKKTNEVDISNLSKGTYFVKVLTDKYVQVEKLVFQ